MLKDILLKTAQLIDRDDIIEELENPKNSSPAIQNDIYRLISYFNYTNEILCENYFNISNEQTFLSDKNRTIYFQNFEFEPTKILKVLKNDKPVFFSVYSKYLTVPEAKTKYNIIYKFTPERVLNLLDKVTLPHGVSEKLICFGMASEFLASKNQVSQAEYWNNKFMLEIFKSKTSQDRRLKQTFTLWKTKHFYLEILNLIQQTVFQMIRILLSAICIT